MGAHRMNGASSRSHAVFTLHVEQTVRGEGGEGPRAAAGDDAADDDDDAEREQTVRSRLVLVDLAGSERVARTGATGATLAESIAINKSLFALRQVIAALAERAARADAGGGADDERDDGAGGGALPLVPYRGSKLTALLKPSLGGNALTLMIACLAPTDASADENASTLQYARAPPPPTAHAPMLENGFMRTSPPV